jgi:hypothetical protein
MNLEIKVKELEMKSQTENVRLNEYRMRMEYLQNEIQDLNTQRVYYNTLIIRVCMNTKIKYYSLNSNR